MVTFLLIVGAVIGAYLEGFVQVQFVLWPRFGYPIGSAGRAVSCVVASLLVGPKPGALILGIGMGCIGLAAGSDCACRLLKRKIAPFPNSQPSPPPPRSLDEIDNLFVVRERLLDFLASTTQEQRDSMVSLLSEEQAEELASLMNRAAGSEAYQQRQKNEALN